jgi:alkanesulfonate monooxygenase SsuD/methylene tetrahydromethanopterin reductase-like flavin-dependent oxidoreductase (luciferase family)
MEPHLGFGITAQRDPARVGLLLLGERLEALRYDELWATDGRHGSGLATLAGALAETRRIDLCLGVAPLSGRTPEEIAEEVDRLRLPHARLVLGVGSGSASLLADVRHGVSVLRRLLPDVRLGIAALGPRMCTLGGEIADLVLLNWAFPDRIEWARGRIAAGAAAAGRPMPRVAGYVRTAVGVDALARLTAAGEGYLQRRRPYARLLDEQHASERGMPGVAASEAAETSALLAPYRAALDSCVVRALPAETGVAGWLEIAEAATLPA